MKQLLLSVFRRRVFRKLLCLAVLSMCLVTFAAQLEIFALGIITRKGPEVFELFSPVQDRKLSVASSINEEQLLTRWREIDAQKKGYITKEDVHHFLAINKQTNVLDHLNTQLNNYFAISSNLTYLAFFLIFVALFKAVTMFMHRYTMRVIAIRISKDLRQQYFEHIQSLPMSFYQQHNIGGLSSRVVGDSALIAEAVDACLVNYIQTPFIVATTLTLCFLTSWQLSIIVFFGFPLIIFPIACLANKVKKISQQIQRNQERFASVLIDFLAGIQTVKVFAMEGFSLKKYQERNQQMAQLEQKSARYDLASRPIVHTIAMFFLATALVYGLYVLQMTVADVFVFCGLLYLFYEPVKKFAEENSHIQRGVAAAERMFEVMNQKPQIEDHPNAVSLQDFSEKLEFNDIWFRYEDQWVIKGLSFTVKKGQTVAIVGPTGAGKSTIVQLIPRLYDVEKGSIVIDGKPIQAYTQKSLREQIAFVPQRPFLFLDTVAQNISFGRPFTQQQIEAASRRAHAEEFILKMPSGYNTELAESGKNLSGGQQQRLAIARALFKNAPILVMDEATSSLDTISEYQIKMAIKELRGQITQIIIAHRLSTIEDADKIIYMEHGQKVAEGTRDELLQCCPPFRRMWEMMHKNEKTG